MDLAIDILQTFVIARPPVEIDRRMRPLRPLLEIVANIADRSHLGPIAANRTIHESFVLRFAHDSNFCQSQLGMFKKCFVAPTSHPLTDLFIVTKICQPFNHAAFDARRLFVRILILVLTVNTPLNSSVTWS